LQRHQISSFLSRTCSWWFYFSLDYSTNPTPTQSGKISSSMNRNVLFILALIVVNRAKPKIPNDGNFIGDKLKDWQVRVADQTTCEENTVRLVQIFKSLGASLTAQSVRSCSDNSTVCYKNSRTPAGTFQIMKKYQH
jgi:hypothetical protein